MTTNIGTSETIVVTNTQGSGTGALTFTATAGGVDIDGADEVNIGSSKDDPAAIVIDASAGGVDILASDAAAGEDIDISATGSSVNLSSNEAVADAITLNASAGGIDITSAGVMDITTSAGNSNITIDPNGSGTLALGSADNTAVTVDAIALTLTAAATGSITIDADNGNEATEDVIIRGNNFSVTDAGVMNVAGALTAASFSGDMTSNALTTDSQNLTVSTTTSGNIILDAVDDIDIDAVSYTHLTLPTSPYV